MSKGGNVGAGIFRAAERFFKFGRKASRETHEIPRFTRQGPHVNPARNTHAEIVNAVAQGRDTHWLTRRLLTEAGPEGQNAIQTLSRYGTKIKYGHGGGYFYDHASNTIHVDLNQNNAAVSIIHEATHAKWAHEGYSADIAKMSRSDYVGRMMNEETDATVRQVYANIHLQTTQPHLNLPNTALQNEFTAGYNAAVHHAESAAQAQGRVLTANERALAGDAGGRQAIHSEYHSGRVTTSTTGTPYPQYYGQAWDGYHGQTP